MSRLARNPISVPEGVTIEIAGQDVKAKGSKGELTYTAHNDIAVALTDAEEGGKVVKVEFVGKKADTKPLWGTTWSNIRNIIEGVSAGYTKELEINGVGYRANVQGKTLVLALGFSHEVRYDIPEGITVEVENQTLLKVSGIVKQQVGQVAAEIRSYRPPEPYKGKGVKYKDEYIFRKEGKKK